MLKKLQTLFTMILLLLSKTAVAHPSVNETLAKLNQEVRSTYNNALALTSKSLDPIIVALGDHLTLYSSFHKTQADIITTEYTQLKTFSHITLGLFAICRYPSEPTFMKQLKNYREQIISAQKIIPSLELTPTQKKRQEKLVHNSLVFIDITLQQNKIDPKIYQAYLQSVQPLIWENVNEAAVAELITVNKQMQRWRQQLSPNAWEHLRVVVIGPHLPREKNILTQYFSKLLHTPVDSSRLIYGESLQTDQDGLNLLARMTLDDDLGKTMFNDRTRMRRDLLSDAAQHYLAHISQ